MKQRSGKAQTAPKAAKARRRSREYLSPQSVPGALNLDAYEDRRGRMYCLMHRLEFCGICCQDHRETNEICCEDASGQSDGSDSYSDGTSSSSSEEAKAAPAKRGKRLETELPGQAQAQPWNVPWVVVVAGLLLAFVVVLGWT